MTLSLFVLSGIRSYPSAHDLSERLKEAVMQFLSSNPAPNCSSDHFLKIRTNNGSVYCFVASARYDSKDINKTVAVPKQVLF